MFSGEPKPLNSLLELWGDSHVVNPANKMFNYSNTGISLSGLAVQFVTGTPYEQHLQSQLLDLLEMSNSDFSGKLSDDNSVKAYQGKKIVEELPLRDTPAGGLNATVNDLSNFLMAIHSKGQFNNKTLIEESTMNEMLTVQNKGQTIDMGLKVGLAWFYASELLGGRHTVVGHDGRTVAHSAKLLTAPEAGLGVVVLTNTADNSGASNRIAKTAMRQLYATKGVPDLPQETASPVLDAIQPSVDLAGDYAGPFNLIRIKPDGKYFNADALGMKASLRPEPNNWHSIKVKLAGLAIQPGDLKNVRVTRSRIAGIDRLIGTDDGEPFLLGDLIEPYTATAQWDSFLGSYTIKNPMEVEAFNPKEVRFGRADNFYYVEIKEQNNQAAKYAIRPINDSQFVFLGSGRGLGGTIEVSYENDRPTFSFAGLLFVQDL
jgi:hypothetical protein